jgi:hypothetical protein
MEISGLEYSAGFVSDVDFPAFFDKNSRLRYSDKGTCSCASYGFVVAFCDHLKGQSVTPLTVPRAVLTLVPTEGSGLSQVRCQLFWTSRSTQAAFLLAVLRHRANLALQPARAKLLLCARTVCSLRRQSHAQQTERSSPRSLWKCSDCFMPSSSARDIGERRLFTTTASVTLYPC